MRAAVVSAYGGGAALGERDDPRPRDGEALVELRAAPINPIDLVVASGQFYAGSPPLPYVPCVEGVGVVLESTRLAPGTRVYAYGGGLGIEKDGTASDCFLAPESTLVKVAEGVEDGVAAAFGTPGLAAWLALSWATTVRADETILVLGATGAVGTIAVQAAKVLGAGRVIGIGRNRERLRRAERRGADATVSLEEADFTERLAAACRDKPPTLVVDALWGPAIEAALTVSGRGARIVHLGQSAGATATIPSAALRGKGTHLMGYSNFAVPPDAFARGYHELLEHVAASRITLDVEEVPLPQVDVAWRRKVSGDEAKLVLIA